MLTVWAVHVGRLDSQLEHQLHRIVPPERSQAADRFRFREDRVRSLAAGALLRWMLTEAGVAPTHQQFTTTAEGKPVLARAGGPHFNLSHSGEWVIGATSDREIGLDVERLDDRAMEIVDRCAPEETAHIMAAPNRLTSFARVWTAKEAYMKWSGLGLHLPLDSFSVVGPQPRVLHGPPRPDTWIHHLPLGGHWVATCSADPQPFRIRRIPAERLTIS